MRRIPRSLALLLLAASACTDRPSPTDAPPPDSVAPPLSAVGLYQIEVNDIGTSQASSSISPVRPDVTASDGARTALTAAGAGLVFEQVASSSFTEGARGQGGQRYVTFTYRVRNGTGVPLDNLTVLLVSRAGTVPGTALSSLRRFDGAPANNALASQVVPTGAVAVGSDLASMQALYPDVLQVLSEAEVAAIPRPADVTDIFPAGYMVRNRNSVSTRLLPATADPNQFDGVLTLSFRLPLQATSAADVFSFFFQILAVTDTERRLTESIEEGQDTAAVRRLRERATTLGATVVTVLNGSPAADPFVVDYPGQRQICPVRTAGPAGAPVALITRPGAYTRLALLRPGETPDACAPYFRSGVAQVANYGMPYNVTLRSMDRYGNPLATMADTVAISSSDGSAVMPMRAGLVSGVRTLTATYSLYGGSTLTAMGRRLRGETVPVLMNGMTRTWTGNVDTHWFTDGDWVQNHHPGVRDSVVIPADRPRYPVLVQNLTTAGITMTPGGVQPSINLGPFDLTVNGNVQLGTTGTFAGTGRLILTGTAATIGGGVSNFNVRNMRITESGRYSVTSNVNVSGGRIVVQGGRLRNERFRIRVQPN